MNTEQIEKLKIFCKHHHVDCEYLQQFLSHACNCEFCQGFLSGFAGMKTTPEKS